MDSATTRSSAAAGKKRKAQSESLTEKYRRQYLLVKGSYLTLQEHYNDCRNLLDDEMGANQHWEDMYDSLRAREVKLATRIIDLSAALKGVMSVHRASDRACKCSECVSAELLLQELRDEGLIN